MTLSRYEVERAYARVRPDVTRRLRALRLDVVYRRALGDLLVPDGAPGAPVTDFVGGYGSTLFGHHHPALTRAMTEALESRAPFAAQGSLRASAAELAERLHQRLREDLGVSFGAMFASTGSEAVELALKHAEMRSSARHEALRQRFEKDVARARAHLASANAGPSASVDGAASDGADLDAVGPGTLDAAALAFDAALRAMEPTLIALRGAFHGKTLGALSITEYEGFRAPFERLLRPVVFVPRGDVDALRQAAADARSEVLWPRVVDGALRLEPRLISSLVALFLEPIQGEGGVHLCTTEFAEAAREVCDRDGATLVFDEIQCGAGRTGSFVYAEQLGVVPDMILLSKSLGGGVAKVSCALSREDRWADGLDLVHSSTFAEDDPGCAVALAGLDLLEGPLEPMERARGLGAELGAGLTGLCATHAAAFAEARGAGLMWGLELRPPAHEGVLAALDSQGLLGYAVAAHLLHESHVRVMPCISSPRTLRFEPSAFLPQAELTLLFEALARVASILERGDAHALLRFLVGLEDPAAPPSGVALERAARAPITSAELPRVAFLGYFLDEAQLAAWDPSLGRFSGAQRQALVARVYREVEPSFVESHVVTSAEGRALELRTYGLFVDSDTFYAGLRGAGRAGLRAQVASALALAEADGCDVAAFGGLTSVITGNCRDVGARRGDIAVTSGNSLTVGACLESAYAAMRSHALRPGAVTAAAVGAGGNIGSVYCTLLAEHVARLVLVSRPGREASLRPLAHRLLERAYGRCRAGQRTGLAAALFADKSVRAWLDASAEPDGAALEAAMQVCPVRITSERRALREASVIFGASNSPRALIEPAHIGDGPLVLIDVAVPGDVHPAVMDLGARVTVVRGGSIDLGPANASLSTLSPLPPGHLYACAAEALVLGFEALRTGGAPQDFSVGALEPAKVRAIVEAAARHGLRPAHGGHRSALEPLRRGRVTRSTLR